jgi:hypothetical protein
MAHEKKPGNGINNEEIKTEWAKHFAFEVIENYKVIFHFSVIKKRFIETKF